MLPPICGTWIAIDSVRYVKEVFAHDEISAPVTGRSTRSGYRESASIDVSDNYSLRASISWRRDRNYRVITGKTSQAPIDRPPMKPPVTD
jgi:hypothetical protein